MENSKPEVNKIKEFWKYNVHPITGYNSSTYYTHVEVKASISENKHLKKKKK